MPIGGVCVTLIKKTSCAVFLDDIGLGLRTPGRLLTVASPARLRRDLLDLLASDIVGPNAFDDCGSHVFAVDILHANDVTEMGSAGLVG